MMAFTTSPAPRYSSQDAKYRISSPEKARIESGEYGGITTSIKESIRESMPVTGRPQTPQQLAGIEKEEEIAGETKYYRGGVEITKQEYEASLLTDADKSELTTRIGELQAQAKVAEELLQGTYQGEKLDPNIAIMDTAGIQRERDSALAKIEVLKSYLEAGQKVPDELKVVISKEVSPVVTFNADGSYGIDVLTGVRNNVPTETLLKIGASQEDIDSAKALNSLQKYKTDTGYDLVKAIDSGDIDIVRKAGFEDRAVYDAQIASIEQKIVSQKLDELEEYKTLTGYDIGRIVKDNKTDVLKRIGVTQAEIDAALIEPIIPAFVGEAGKVGGKELLELEDYKAGSGYDLGRYLFDNKDNLPKQIEYLESLGFDNNTVNSVATFVRASSTKPTIIKDEDVINLLPEDRRAIYKTLSAGDKLSILQSEGLVPITAGYVGKTITDEPITQVSNINSINMAIANTNIAANLDAFIPVYGTAKYWNDMGVMGKTISVVGDVLFFIPLIKSASYGAKAVTQVGRTARLMGAAKGIGTEAISQIKAPINMVLHPVESGKSGFVALRELLENVNMRKIPEAVLTTSNATIRIPINTIRTESEAVVARNKLMDLIAKGEKPVIEIGNTRYEITTSAFMKEVGGGLAHATPQGEAFLEGLKVATKAGKPAAEQGLFMANEPLPRFIRKSAFGLTGDKPAIIITSPEIAKYAVQTDKVYTSGFRKVAELEKKFPVGFEIPKPTQKLYTRIGYDGLKVEILLDKPLTPKQIIKLKSLAIVEDLKAPFKPSILIDRISDTNKLVDEDDIKLLVSELRRSGNEDIARSLSSAFKYSKDYYRLGQSSVTDYGTIRYRDLDGKERVERLIVRATGDRNSARYTRTDRQDRSYRLQRDVNRINRYEDIIRRQLGRASLTRIVPRDGSRVPIIPRDSGRVPIDPRDGERVPNIPRDNDNMRGRATIDRSNVGIRVPRILRDSRVENTSKVTRITNRGSRIKPIFTQQKSMDSAQSTKYAGAITWRQGALKRNGKLQSVWYVINPPYASKNDVSIVYGKAPEGAKVVTGLGSAYKTIQSIKGDVPKLSLLTIDMGIQDISITRQKGKKLKMKYSTDKNQKTDSQISISGVKL